MFYIIIHHFALIISKKTQRMPNFAVKRMCHSGNSDSGESAIPLVEILIGVSTGGVSDPLFKSCNRSSTRGKL